MNNVPCQIQGLLSSYLLSPPQDRFFPFLMGTASRKRAPFFCCLARAEHLGWVLREAGQARAPGGPGLVKAGKPKLAGCLTDCSANCSAGLSYFLGSQGPSVSRCEGFSPWVQGQAVGKGPCFSGSLLGSYESRTWPRSLAVRGRGLRAMP